MRKGKGALLGCIVDKIVRVAVGWCCYDKNTEHWFRNDEDDATMTMTTTTMVFFIVGGKQKDARDFLPIIRL